MLGRIACGLALALSFIAPAIAQEGLSTKPDYDTIYRSDRVDENAGLDISRLRIAAAAALEASDFATAETKLLDLSTRVPVPPDTAFMMGLAKTGLGKWDDARVWLERAVEAEPARPEPKTRLALAYVMLGNPDAARGQRAALAMLDAGCAKTCADAVWIADGLRLIDDALARGAAVARAAKIAVEVSSGEPKAFDPGRYGLVEFRNQSELYDLLTQPGRCPVKEPGTPGQPCALILYRSADGAPETAMASNFKPVFKVVSRNVIWAIHDKQLQKIRIDDLYFDNDNIIGGQKGKYISVALVGNAENAANCSKGQGCLADLVSENMFTAYRNMPDNVITIIWPQGMKDSGTIRVR